MWNTFEKFVPYTICGFEDTTVNNSDNFVFFRADSTYCKRPWTFRQKTNGGNYKFVCLHKTIFLKNILISKSNY